MVCPTPIIVNELPEELAIEVSRTLKVLIPVLLVVSVGVKFESPKFFIISGKSYSP